MDSESTSALLEGFWSWHCNVCNKQLISKHLKQKIIDKYNATNGFMQANLESIWNKYESFFST